MTKIYKTKPRSLACRWVNLTPDLARSLMCRRGAVASW